MLLVIVLEWYKKAKEEASVLFCLQGVFPVLYIEGMISQV